VEEAAGVFEFADFRAGIVISINNRAYRAGIVDRRIDAGGGYRISMLDGAGVVIPADCQSLVVNTPQLAARAPWIIQRRKRATRAALETVVHA
jgi:putative component of toxin-antitoxin plasmid stabilization module